MCYIASQSTVPPHRGLIAPIPEPIGPLSVFPESMPSIVNTSPASPSLAARQLVEGLIVASDPDSMAQPSHRTAAADALLEYIGTLEAIATLPPREPSLFAPLGSAERTEADMRHRRALMPLYQPDTAEPWCAGGFTPILAPAGCYEAMDTPLELYQDVNPDGELSRCPR